MAQTPVEQAARLHNDALVCDMTLPWRAPGRKELQGVLPERLEAGGVDFVSYTVATDDQDAMGAILAIAEERGRILAAPERFVLVETADDVRRAKAAGKLAIGLHFQGTLPVGRNLGLVEIFYKLGIRHMLMAYNQKNLVADGCHELTDAGISRFGHELVAEMNRVGMFVDVAHTGYRSSMEVIEASQSPVICSHGNIKGLWEHARCYRDDQIQAIAASGGVFGLTGLGIFMGDNDASVERYAEQIDYVVQLVGPRHVGFGFDYMYDMPTLSAHAAEMASKWPSDGGYTRQDIKQLEPESIPEITEQLLRRGYGEGDIRLVLGENWLRMMDEIWR
jgi:membrane dipeptidase